MPQHSLPGAVMGTVGYMSPEQAQGRVKEIDHRSDIFSFGCILFEATTGQKAFEGADALDSLHKIVHAPAPQIKDFNAAAPDEIQRIVQRCLAKDPNKRYHSIKDVALELEEIRQELKSAELEYSVPPAAAAIARSAGSTQSGIEGTQQLSDGAATIGAVRSTSSAEYVINEIKRHKRGALVALTSLIVLAVGVSFVLYKFLGRRSTFASGPLKITRLTSTGQVNHAAISPDGKYVVYAQDEGKQESLWMTQVAASSNVQIAPPSEAHYQGITFSRDGNFIYYVRIDKDNPAGALYQMPALGSNAHKLLVNVFGPITLSPDGKRIAFVRCEGCITTLSEGQGESALIVANSDGSDEKKLAVHQVPDVFSPGGPAWSPDGNVIACGKTHRGGRGGSDGPYRNVVAVRVSDGMEQPITSQRWDGPGLTDMRMTWLTDNSGVLVTGVEQGRLSQIWYLAWPGNEARNVTNDVNSYADLSLTGDSDTLVAVRFDRVINLWVAPNGDASNARRITSGAERADGERGISWTPDGKIVYFSTPGANQNIWIMQPDGSENKQLSSSRAQNIEPAVSPDGRYVVWASRQSGQWELWRMDIDGSNPKKLTGQGYFQDVSHDGKWVIYTTPPATLWKIPIDGGDPIRLMEAHALRPVISPDGGMIACNYQAQIPALLSGERFKVAILPATGGEPIKLLDISAANGLIRWTPDGRAIAYILNSNGVSNIWAQPLDGGPPKQLTDFKSERIFNFAWSRDGQQLALSRGVVNKDVVLITGFK
jgi:Tol biopolymer transport system component